MNIVHHFGYKKSPFPAVAIAALASAMLSWHRESGSRTGTIDN
jgi:hypothetical protein